MTQSHDLLSTYIFIDLFPFICFHFPLAILVLVIAVALLSTPLAMQGNDITNAGPQLVLALAATSDKAADSNCWTPRENTKREQQQKWNSYSVIVRVRPVVLKRIVVGKMTFRQPWAEIVFRVKWIVLVSRWCYDSGPFKVIGHLSHDSIGWNSGVNKAKA